MKAIPRLLALFGMAPALAGCAVGGIAAFNPMGAAPPPPAPPAPAPIAYGAFLEGPVGQKLTAGDRDKALAAEQDALASGQRRTWRGANGTFGYVEPAPAPATPVLAADGGVPTPPAAEVCRGFTSTVFFGGRPQSGHGQGCQNPDGSYRITG